MSFSVRPYQHQAAEWLSRRKRGLLVSPAGSGKTIIAAYALDMAIKSRVRGRKVRIGWMANTREQCQQAQKAMDIFPLVAKQDIRIACAAAATDWSDRDVLVGDELHHLASAQGWQSQVETCKGAIWGMTATPPEDPALMAVLMRFCEKSYVISREDVANNLAPAVVRWLDATDPGLKEPIDREIDRVVRIRQRYWSGDQGQLWGQVAFQTCVELGIIQNKARNAAAIQAAINEKPTLVLVNQVEHGQTLAASIPGAVPCYSAMGAKARREALEAFTAGSVRCLIATSLADEGLDLPNAEVLVMVSGGKSAARMEQRTGRVLRKFLGKTHGQIYDFKDSFHPLAAKHGRARGELYAKLGYTILP